MRVCAYMHVFEQGNLQTVLDSGPPGKELGNPVLGLVFP